MDFTIPKEINQEKERFKEFLDRQVKPNLPEWYRDGAVPSSFHLTMGQGGWYGFKLTNGRIEKQPGLRSAILGEEIAALSPGVAVAVLAQSELGLTGLWLYASDALTRKYAEPALNGRTLICLGNTETGAGSDSANISMTAVEADGGWYLNGTKAYVTNGLISDLAVVTAVTNPQAPRGRRISMFLVDLRAEGVTRRKLNKQVWVPSDLTRIQLNDVFVPQDHILGESGRGLQQVLNIFTHSRVALSTLTLGTAVGAFEMALSQAQRREIFGKKIMDFQAKAFEIADFYARIEAARLMLYRACWAMDQGGDFRMEASLAKYLSVMIAREVSTWAADLFGAASVIFEHPIHKFPLDAWASSLGEGTQDIQKLVIFREVMKLYGNNSPPE
jgi:alkylation response protein AidB-like acyl-CoA dehydrogenase